MTLLRGRVVRAKEENDPTVLTVALLLLKTKKSGGKDILDGWGPSGSGKGGIFRSIRIETTHQGSNYFLRIRNDTYKDTTKVTKTKQHGTLSEGQQVVGICREGAVSFCCSFFLFFPVVLFIRSIFFFAFFLGFFLRFFS